MRPFVDSLHQEYLKTDYPQLAVYFEHDEQNPKIIEISSIATIDNSVNVDVETDQKSENGYYPFERSLDKGDYFIEKTSKLLDDLELKNKSFVEADILEPAMFNTYYDFQVDYDCFGHIHTLLDRWLIKQTTFLFRSDNSLEVLMVFFERLKIIFDYFNFLESFNHKSGTDESFITLFKNRIADFMDNSAYGNLSNSVKLAYKTLMKEILNNSDNIKIDQLIFLLEFCKASQTAKKIFESLGYNENLDMFDLRIDWKVSDIKKLPQTIIQIEDAIQKSPYIFSELYVANPENHQCFSKIFLDLLFLDNSDYDFFVQESCKGPKFRIISDLVKKNYFPSKIECKKIKDRLSRVCFKKLLHSELEEREKLHDQIELVFSKFQSMLVNFSPFLTLFDDYLELFHDKLIKILESNPDNVGLEWNMTNYAIMSSLSKQELEKWKASWHQRLENYLKPLVFDFRQQNLFKCMSYCFRSQFDSVEYYFRKNKELIDNVRLWGGPNGEDLEFRLMKVDRENEYLSLMKSKKVNLPLVLKECSKVMLSKIRKEKKIVKLNSNYQNVELDYTLSEQTVHLECSIFTAVILLNFENTDIIDYKVLMKKTGMTPDVFSANIMKLTNVGLIVQVGNNVHLQTTKTFPETVNVE